MTHIAQKYSKAFVLLILFVVSACSDARLKPLGYGATILAFGDSLTSGVGVKTQYSYPSILSELTGREVINAGVSGELTEQGVARLPYLLQSHAVDVLVLIEGGNDILRNKNLKQTKQNLAAMIEMAQAKNIDVILVGMPLKKLFSKSAPLYGELAEQYQLTYDGEIIRELMTDTDMKSDSVHFNKQGYRALANAIDQLMQDNGAL
ncbi:GDSL-type esterase/lipase family protein [Thalassotalea sp. Y01]|uniref:GDSL-type esterase/lipase family protein n=1 Tax=Thalassotalea sp. Y01 TaxID=2729613 RepID=UPI00145C8F9C|nr:GDSL-type esterase/lipase family protein [Thalassotalea sp. Y01]NMP17595.1 arylesterase [Thalassotalea sp. Y01]